MSVIAHVAVEVLSRPKWSSPPQQPVGLLSGMRLPGMYNGIETISGPNLNQGMDMVGHDAPRSKSIPVPVKSKQRCLNQLGYERVLQVTAAKTTVERCIDSRASFVARQSSDLRMYVS